MRERVAAVSFTFGLPSAAVLGELRRAGIETVVTVTDVDEARAALDAGVDGLCVQGAEAGGHRGTLDPAAEPDGADLVDLVERVRRAASQAGRADVAISPRAASPPASGPTPCERPAPTPCRSAPPCSSLPRRAPAWPIDAPWPTRPTQRTAVTRAFSGRLGRCLETDFVRRHDGEAPAAYPEVHHVTVPLRRASARADRPDLVALWAGTGWRSARPVPAATVVAGLAR